MANVDGGAKEPSFRGGMVDAIKQGVGTGIERRRFFKISLAAAALGGSAYIAPTAMATEDRPTPKLRFQCSPAELQQRAAALKAEQSTYKWSMDIENVEGIPMVEALPVGEHPTVDWLIEFIYNFIDLADNLIDSASRTFFPTAAPVLEVLNERVKNLSQQVTVKVGEYSELIKKYDRKPLNAAVEATDKVFITALSGFLLGVLAELQNIRRSLFSTVEEQFKRDRHWIGDFGERKNLEKYRNMWASLPIPEVSEHLHDDRYFGYARVAGPNPEALTLMTAVPEKLALDEGQFKKVTGEEFSVALADSRVYQLDYEELGDMAKEHSTFKIVTGDNYNTAPIAVFHRAKDQRYLMPVCIQIGQNKEHSPVFYRPEETTTDGAEYWGWQMAKTVVQTADFNHHEMFSHLAQTHLVSEGFCVATHRQLPPGHPLRELLEPHFEGDLYINNLAAAIIMGPYTMADDIIAAPVKEQAAAAARARVGWNLKEMVPHRDLESRGLMDPDLEHPYRDDALSVWEEISTWVTDYVAVYYSSDEDVKKDEEFKAWVDDCVENGKFTGMEYPQTREELVEMVSCVIFTASAQHAAVNYIQRDQMTYAPYYSGTLASLPDKQEGEYTEDDWYNMLPTFLSAFAQMYFLNVLGSVYYRRLGDYRTNVFPYRPALTDPRVQEPLHKFNAALKNLEGTINERNTDRSWEYPYLLPTNIPMSTNV